MHKIAIAISFLLLWLNIDLAASGPSVTQWVNPFIGTAPNPYTHDGYPWDTGNVFPGAVCPRGMVEWSPDTTHQNQIAGGYWFGESDGGVRQTELLHCRAVGGVEGGS